MILTQYLEQEQESRQLEALNATEIQLVIQKVQHCVDVARNSA